MAHAIFIGKPSRNGQFSMAMLVITRGYIFIDIPILRYSNLISTHSASSQRKIVESAQWSCQLTLYAKFLARSRCVQDTLATWSFRSFHTVSMQFPYSFHTVSIQFPYSFHTVSIPYSFHTVSIQFPYSFHTVSMQFPYSFHSRSMHDLALLHQTFKGLKPRPTKTLRPIELICRLFSFLGICFCGSCNKKISAEKRSPQKGAMI